MICKKCQLYTDPEKMIGDLCDCCAAEKCYVDPTEKKDETVSELIGMIGQATKAPSSELVSFSQSDPFVYDTFCVYIGEVDNFSKRVIGYAHPNYPGYKATKVVSAFTADGRNCMVQVKFEKEEPKQITKRTVISAIHNGQVVATKEDTLLDSTCNILHWQTGICCLATNKDITIRPAVGTINGKASLVLSPGQGVWIGCDGVNFFLENGYLGRIV